MGGMQHGAHSGHDMSGHGHAAQGAVQCWPTAQGVMMQVPVKMVGAIMGRGGTMIRQINAQSGATIRIQNKEDMTAGAEMRQVTSPKFDHQIVAPTCS